MKRKWIHLKDTEELRDVSIVTQLINKGKQKHVTIGYPGWSCKNGTIAYRPLPQDITIDYGDWKSEYRGDEEPFISDWYIVQIQNKRGKFDIIKLYFDTKLQRFLAVPNDVDIIAWMAFPKAI